MVLGHVQVLTASMGELATYSGDLQTVVLLHLLPGRQDLPKDQFRMAICSLNPVAGLGDHVRLLHLLVPGDSNEAAAPVAEGVSVTAPETTNPTAELRLVRDSGSGPIAIPTGTAIDFRPEQPDIVVQLSLHTINLATEQNEAPPAGQLMVRRRETAETEFWVGYSLVSEQTAPESPEDSVGDEGMCTCCFEVALRDDSDV